MNASDRLTARALLVDELYAAKSKAEYERDQAVTRVKELEAENAILRGEPNPAAEHPLS